MNRRGFALLTTLWLVTALSTIAAASLLVARLGLDTTGNRMVLTRARWAREACGAILLARYARDPSTRRVDTLDLGSGAWCRAELEDPEARLDLNLATAEALQRVIGSDSLVDALLDWRDPDDVERPQGAESEWYRIHQRRLPRNGPLADVTEMASIRGFDSVLVRRLALVLTVSGSPRLDLNAAPPELLPLLPGVGEEAVGVILRRRAEGRPLASTDELLSLLSPASRQVLLGQYREFTAMAAYAPGRMVAVLEGGVRGTRPVSREWRTVVPAVGRLAVVRRAAQ
jgi:general secretion pathway protein K